MLLRYRFTGTLFSISGMGLIKNGPVMVCAEDHLFTDLVVLPVCVLSAHSPGFIMIKGGE